MLSTSLVIDSKVIICDAPPFLLYSELEQMYAGEAGVLSFFSLSLGQRPDRDKNAFLRPFFFRFSAFMVFFSSLFSVIPERALSAIAFTHFPYFGKCEISFFFPGSSPFFPSLP